MTKDEASAVVTSLFESSYSVLVRYAFWRIGSMAIAEEMVQDALFALYRELRCGKTIGHPKAWTLCVLNRKARRQISRKMKEGLTVGLDILEETPATGSGYSPFFAGDRVRDLLAALSKREQTVVLLRLESLKYHEIAELMGVKCSTISTMLTRALRKLRRLTTNDVEEEALPAHETPRDSETLQ